MLQLADTAAALLQCSCCMPGAARGMLRVDQAEAPADCANMLSSLFKYYGCHHYTQ
jgi:hypothetical protein